MTTVSRREFLGSLAGLASVSLVSSGALGADEDGATIMDKSRNAQRVELSSVSEMLLVERGGKMRKRKLELMTKKFDGAWRSYLKFSFPPDIAGTQFLVLEHKDIENDMFLYQPINKRTRRVTPAQRSGRFVGTDFYYEDLDIRDVGRDEHSLVRREDLKLVAGGREQVVSSWVVQSTPKPRWPSVYTRVLTWVERGNYYPRQVELYKGTELAKRFRVMTIEKSERSIVPMLSEMSDLKSGSRTILVNERYSLDRTAIPDAIFTEAHLLTGG